MLEEIKEILDKWKCYIGITKKFTTNEYEMLRVEDIDKLLDYITNLQEENERLTKLKERYQLEKEVYKSRNEKAIEYCNYNDESLYTFEPDYDYEENMIDNYEPSNFREDLLNILNGGDKE